MKWADDERPVKRCITGCSPWSCEQINISALIMQEVQRACWSTRFHGISLCKRNNNTNRILCLMLQMSPNHLNQNLTSSSLISGKLHYYFLCWWFLWRQQQQDWFKLSDLRFSWTPEAWRTHLDCKAKQTFLGFYCCHQSSSAQKLEETSWGTEMILKFYFNIKTDFCFFCP